MTSPLDQGERALWLAVIAQHIEDATSNGRARQEAREWLTVPNDGFAEVCACAGLEADNVRKAALAKITAFDVSPPTPRRTPNQSYTHNGESRTTSEWADHLGIAYATLYQRLARGLSIEQALTVEGRGVKAQTYSHDGKTLTVQQWAELAGVSAKLIQQRLARGMTFADAISRHRHASNAGKAGPFGFNFDRQAIPV